MPTINNWTELSYEDRVELLRGLIQGSTQEAPDYINLVKAGQTHGVYASMGPRFAHAIFGRDSIEVAEDLLGSHEPLVRHIILLLARLQGTKTDTVSEEEPGKIHHEYRAKIFDGGVIPEQSLQILHDLQHVWGGEGTDEMIYYGSFDATPLYIRLVCRYIVAYDHDILEEQIVGRDNVTRSLRECVHNSILWLENKINESPWGLFEYRRINPNGLVNQTWKDSTTSYLHLDGTPANADGGIASAELQGYAYDALLGAAQYIAEEGEDRHRWRSLAASVQSHALALLWMPEQQYFAQGADRGPDGKLRQIQTIVSNGALLLDSVLLVDLPEDKRLTYVDGIVQTITSEAFITQAGIRCRSLEHRNLLGYVDYHDSYTVWPKETYDISKGLRAHGYDEKADELDSILLDSIQRSGDFYEFFYVDGSGKVWYDRDEAMAHFGAMSLGHSLPYPEPGQAWTISAVLGILSKR